MYKEQTNKLMLSIAKTLSNECKCNKLKVGAVIVKDKRIISSGVNGSLKNFSNVCEDTFIECHKCGKLIPTENFKNDKTLFNKKVYTYTCECSHRLDYEEDFFNKVKIKKTKPHILHAEENALIFAAKHGINIDGTSIYVTHLPCMRCARMIIASGIEEVFYIEEYRDKSSINLFKNNNIKIEQIRIDDEN